MPRELFVQTHWCGDERDVFFFLIKLEGRGRAERDKSSYCFSPYQNLLHLPTC